jgi:hypothetical protein
MHFNYKKFVPTPRLMFNLFLTIMYLGIIFSFGAADAAQVTLGWNENSAPNVTGYRLYYRACQSNESCTSIGAKSSLTKISIPVGQLSNASQPTYTVKNLADGPRYIFAATAYTSSQESAFSNSVVYKSAAVNGNQAPVVNAGADKTVALASNNLTLSGKVTDDGRPANGNLIVEWSKYSGPGTVTFGSPFKLSTTARFSKAGTYQILLEGDDGERIGSDLVKVVVTSSGTPTPSSPNVIVDNRNTARTARTGKWLVSGAGNPYGRDSLYSNTGATFTWKFTPAKSGIHNVTMWWTYLKSRHTSIPVTIIHAAGKKVVRINQQNNAGKWFNLGNYRFQAGKTYTVTIKAPAGSATTCADAVGFKFIKP